MNRNSFAKFLIPILAVVSVLPFISSAEALIAGALIALLLENPYPTQKWVHLLLGVAVAGLGAGMNLETVAKVGAQGIGYTVFSIAGVFIVGFILKRLLKVEDEIGLLITVGTAICGGSAIAAVTPVIRAKSHSVSVALGTVFILNAIALLIFPTIGHYFNMPERAFGLWSALAIHDTSSVVGASVTYGPIAAEVGTTVKLARALWIVPITLLIGLFNRSANGDARTESKSKKPWFILWFILVAALVTWVPALRPTGHVLDLLAKRLLVLTLFLIGLGLSRETLKSVGVKPLLFGISLWIVTSVVTFELIHIGVIN